MKTLAALCGVFVGLVLAVMGYAMSLGEQPGYVAPFLLAVAALVTLPVLYWLKADRRLPKLPSRILFATMLGGLAASWWPLANSPALRAAHGGALAVFSAVWLVAALPFLRAGIRHRPR